MAWTPDSDEGEAAPDEEWMPPADDETMVDRLIRELTEKPADRAMRDLAARDPIDFDIVDEQTRRARLDQAFLSLVERARANAAIDALIEAPSDERRRDSKTDDTPNPEK